MTARARTFLQMIAVTLGFATFFVMLCGWLYDIAYAAAAPLPDAGDAAGWASSLYQFVQAGSHVPAVGAFLVLVVWGLRKFASKITWKNIGAWFLTTIGGYVLGFSTAAILYFGLALSSGGPVTWSLVGSAVGSAYAASGGWEHLKDVFNYLGKKPPIAVTTSAACFALVMIAASCSGCPSVTDSKPVADIIDCTKQDAAKIEALAVQLGCKVVAGAISECTALSGDWATIEASAESAGVAIGGCVLSEIVQQYLAKPKAEPVDRTWMARDALEHFRSTKAHGATFRTTIGDL